MRTTVVARGMSLRRVDIPEANIEAFLCVCFFFAYLRVRLR